MFLFSFVLKLVAALLSLKDLRVTSRELTAPTNNKILYYFALALLPASIIYFYALKRKSSKDQMVAILKHYYFKK